MTLNRKSHNCVVYHREQRFWYYSRRCQMCISAPTKILIAYFKYYALLITIIMGRVNSYWVSSPGGEWGELVTEWINVAILQAVMIDYNESIEWVAVYSIRYYYCHAYFSFISIFYSLYFYIIIYAIPNQDRRGTPRSSVVLYRCIWYMSYRQ